LRSERDGVQAAAGSIGLIESYTNPAIFSPHASAIETQAFNWQHQSEVVGNPGYARNIQSCPSLGHVPHHAAKGAVREFYHAGFEYRVALRNAIFHGPSMKSESEKSMTCALETSASV
jgi:hypothetical protein